MGKPGKVDPEKERTRKDSYSEEVHLLGFLDNTITNADK